LGGIFITEWLDKHRVDILSASNATEKPKTHDLGFCFFPLLVFRNCLYPQGAFWSYVRSTDHPRKPCGFYVSKT